MYSFSKYTRTFLTLLHLVLGVLLLLGSVSKIYSILILFIGLLVIFKTKNKHNEAMFWSGYLVGGEVLFRMSGGMFFHELPKYAVLLFLFMGLMVETKRHHVSVSYLIYILLLLIGIAFVDIPFNESIRKAIAFNLSGPILLGVAAIYFYGRKITLTALLNVLFVMCLPIISMLSYLYFKTPDIKDIAFGGTANFETSGGYGPNQVATILGLGVFILVVHLFLKKRFLFVFSLDILLLLYLLFRGLITLSRGGMLTAFIAIVAFAFFYILSREDRVISFLKYAGLMTLFLLITWIYSADLTGGMLTNRYANKNAAGVVKEDVSTGRIDLFESELEAFFEHPFFGIGVGGSKYKRIDESDIVAASHNEISRLLGEHGMIGLLILGILLIIPIRNMFKQPLLTVAFLSAFLIFWFLTINHSAMRVAFPAFIYGLSLIILEKDKENEEATVYRK
ncbi:O-antigen ligase family protein [Lutibacter maritimus]|uniref:O-antigen ligase like membrane protein n=1 Tax=Lutibacter maritimus TaxID=593133 RepID=A0A1I6P5E4_9FLAO|nr:O-antigen ligase family protein [Lutibacter maritimus]SFS35351.1 O-antigen ligase like membrane protein [Lutibacter maritimus]